MAVATAPDTGRVIGKIVLPTLANGVIVRRPRSVALAEPFALATREKKAVFTAEHPSITVARVRRCGVVQPASAAELGCPYRFRRSGHSPGRRGAPMHPGWLRLADQVPLVDTSRARQMLDWQPEHDTRDTLQQFGVAVARGDSAPSAPLQGGSGRLGLGGPTHQSQSRKAR